ncbi:MULTISPECIES: argininosuccinate synthase [Paenibacillus]|jgi:argininosuccinate synthase|uniref:Argininosuccinate synthase n=2 Tax=Paenibacillus TaxID=44249 RepID=A0ABX2ZDN2_PAEPO|nr:MULTISPECIES: argininosuccinate synthase [Paenibacillus]AIW41925.1 argininosuccinate synthase [Paenibacillus polymyxa CR1]ALA44173.1 argininosuccinate synthase [Paenibacillus peoriae]MCP3745927.1 argininosuccinate synthase [Paenibacillus sp. A3M_27_13]MDR6778913.1 argininosuccinate synthase [Paenibacillus peoriae]ODA09599.1 argininosuccinate synthase [Paenibacillus polymyxa]
MAKEKIVLAYSGGLDTSVILKWLKETYDAEIIAFTADIGQKEELDGLEEKALATGASKVYIDDLRDEFAKDFIYPMFQAGALYEGQYLLGTSIARPLIAKRMVDIAIAEGATAIAHGATGKGNDQVRFELNAAALTPDIKVIAPWRLEEFRNQFPGRAEMIAYAEKHDIPVTASAAKPYSMDRNLLHISYESGVLEDPWFDPSAPENKEMFLLSNAPEDAPDEAEYLELEFEAGNCVALNGEQLNPLQVMEKLNELGGKHGIGRVDMVENRFVGMKSRGVYETPGGTILFTAHRKMESITMDREVMNLRDSLITRYATLVYNGFWFAPERVALQALVHESQKNVSGTVRVKLYKGNVIGAGVKSPVSLYNPDIATMEADPTQAYDQGDATGFIRLNALRLKVNAGVTQNHK